MKRFFLVFFVLVAFFLQPLLNTTAAGPGPRPNLTPVIPFAVPGLNCGYADIVGKDSCCVTKNPEFDVVPNDYWGPFLTKIWEILPFHVVQNIFSKFADEKRAGLGLIGISCQSGVPDSDPATNPDCKCINAVTPSPGWIGALNGFCQSQYNLSDRNSCLNCANGGGVWSGLGCVKTDFKSFIEETVFGFGVGLAGGLSLLCIIYAAFMMQSSEGNPEKLKKAQEMITSCIIGLMLIIFSVFILKLIGVNILKIPGFS
ncbi:MAG: hypothetical protein WCT22_01815 [Patescibacteria group bacterium]